MRIIFDQTKRTTYQTWLANQEYDLPDAEANKAIKEGVAKEVVNKPEVTKPESKPESKPEAKKEGK